MSDTRAGLPPEIPGYDYLETLGSGGFADVYVYEQALPRRRVAIKVLRPEAVTPEAAALFHDEADFLARLSAHPNIVSLHHAGTLDDGRLFLALEYCSRPGLAARFRNERFEVPEVLSIGVQLADAVETAHRAGVLHRDIKPANVLVTDFGRPALTDFGIAATLGRGATARAVGLSLPWAAPESVDSGWSGPETDVWGLGATLYSLLAGRSPFEGPGESPSPEALADRIRDVPLPPLGRPDVPPSLEDALRTALAKAPQGRFTSALSFARALQRVQHELGLPVTDIDVSGGSATGPMPRLSGRSGSGLSAAGASQPTAYRGDPRTEPLDLAGGAAPTAYSARADAAGGRQPVPQAWSGTGTAHPPTAPTSITFDALLRDDDDPTVNANSNPFAPAGPAAGRGAGPAQGYGAPAYGMPGTGPAGPRGDTNETRLRGAGTGPGPAPAAPNFVVAPKPPSRAPGIVLDVALVLAVAGAAAYLVLG